MGPGGQIYAGVNPGACGIDAYSMEQMLIKC